MQTGFLLRRVQQAELLGMPYSRPMPSIGPRCHELRVRDEDLAWRVVYRIDADAVIVVDVFAKKTRATRKTVIESCRRRLKEYDNA